MRDAVEIYSGRGPRGGVAWDLVSAHMGHIRTPKQCSKRWLKTLQPKLQGARSGPWTEEEVRLCSEYAALVSNMRSLRSFAKVWLYIKDKANVALFNGNASPSIWEAFARLTSAR